MTYPLPYGRLGLTQTTRWVGDITGASTLYYTNDQVCYSLGGPWSPNSQFDIFWNDATATLRFQPWAARVGDTPPTPLSPFADLYIGSINTDANGLLNQHKTPGPTRRWDVWNAYNQKPIDIQVLDATGNLPGITTSQGNWHPITPNSYATFIIGLPESANGFYLQQVYPLSSNVIGSSCWAIVGIGWGTQYANPVPWTWPVLTNMPGGYYGQCGEDIFETSPTVQMAPGGNNMADYTSIDNVGVQTVYAVYIANEVTGTGADVTYFGKNAAHRIMHIRYMG